jgi:hypothetical protein
LAVEEIDASGVPTLSGQALKLCFKKEYMFFRHLGRVIWVMLKALSAVVLRQFLSKSDNFCHFLSAR